MKLIILLALCFGVISARSVNRLNAAIQILKPSGVKLREALSSTRTAWWIFQEAVNAFCMDPTKFEVYLNTLHENMNILSTNRLINAVLADSGADKSIMYGENLDIEKSRANMSDSFSSIIKELKNPSEDAHKNIKEASKAVYINFGHISLKMIRWYTGIEDFFKYVDIIDAEKNFVDMLKLHERGAEFTLYSMRNLTTIFFNMVRKVAESKNAPNFGTKKMEHVYLWIGMQINNECNIIDVGMALVDILTYELSMKRVQLFTAEDESKVNDLCSEMQNSMNILSQIYTDCLSISDSTPYVTNETFMNKLFDDCFAFTGFRVKLINMVNYLLARVFPCEIHREFRTRNKGGLVASISAVPPFFRPGSLEFPYRG